MSRRRAGLWQMDEESEARPHRPLVKEKGDGVERWHAFRPGFATNLHEMGVPTKVTKRVCRHADEEALHPRRGTDVRSGMRKLEASITREKTRETLNGSP
jgi:hypothetical protein